jgi:PPM family protein phosphatase
VTSEAIQPGGDALGRRAPAVRLRVGSRTDVGLVRDQNEDSMLVCDPLFAVADGMGGHAGGEVASRLAIHVLEGLLPPPRDSRSALLNQCRKANHQVLERGQMVAELRGMGTTLTALLIDGRLTDVVHVGDSRAYLSRNGSLRQLTDDHSLVQQMVRSGALTRGEAKHHPSRGVLTRVLGMEEDVDLQQLTVDLHPADRILLCTDGLTGMLADDHIQAILSMESDPQMACDRLVERAKAAGGEDNITTIIIDIDTNGFPGR